MFRTGRWFALLAACAQFGLVWAATVPLEPFSGANFTISMPKAWKIVEDAGNGVIMAREDPSREDSAALILLVKAAGANVTEDQLLDTVTNQFAKDLSIRRREAMPGGGHLLIADGRAGNLAVRVGVIAVSSGPASLVGVLVSKPNDFDVLGGIELVTGVLASLRVRDAAAQPAPPPPAAPVAPAPGPGGKLDVPPLSRQLTFADLAGEWSNDNSVLTNYVNYHGDYAGFQSIAIRDKWAIDGQGGISSVFNGVTAGFGGARQINERKTGTVIFSQGPVMAIAWKGAAQPSYIIRGWRDLPGMTVLVLNGPWWNGQIPPDVLADRKKGKNLDNYWYRKANP